MPPTEATPTPINGHIALAQAPEAPRPAPPPNPFDALWDATRLVHFYQEGLRANAQDRNVAGLDVAELMHAAQADLVVDGERVFLLIPSVGGGPPYVRVKRGVYLHTLDALVRTQVERKAGTPPPAAHACCNDPRLPEPDDEAINEAAAHAALQDLQAAGRAERAALLAIDRCVMGDGSVRPGSDAVEREIDGSADELRGLDRRIASNTAVAR